MKLNKLRKKEKKLESEKVINLLMNVIDVNNCQQFQQPSGDMI